MVKLHHLLERKTLHVSGEKVIYEEIFPFCGATASPLWSSGGPEGRAATAQDGGAGGGEYPFGVMLPALRAFKFGITVFDASPFLKFIAAFLTFVFVDWHFSASSKVF